ncbi:hypothetical protein GCM10009788_25830 [Nocardioides humi]|uniref:Uncharacterized protein n=2 Tax=Nocardioides humi TaxID=449461 RepID=A0ABN2AKT4_9ACTN
MRTHTDGHVVSVVLTMERCASGGQAPIPDYRRPGVVHLLGDDSRTLCSWPVVGTSSTYEWVTHVITRSASEHFTAGGQVVTVERVNGVNMMTVQTAERAGEEDIEPSVTGRFSVDDDLILTIVEAAPR